MCGVEKPEHGETLTTSEAKACNTLTSMVPACAREGRITSVAACGVDPRLPVTMEGMADVHDNAPDAFDDELAEAEVHVTPGDPDIAVTVTVPLTAGHSTV